MAASVFLALAAVAAASSPSLLSPPLPLACDAFTTTALAPVECSLVLLAGYSYVIGTDCASLSGETQLTLQDSDGTDVSFNDGWPGCPNLSAGTSSSLLEIYVDCSYGPAPAFTLLQDCVKGECSGAVSVAYDSKQEPEVCPTPPAPSPPTPSSPPPSVPPRTFSCTQQDSTCAALGDLYYALGGPRWLVATGWQDAAAGRPTSYCSFYAVGGFGCKGDTLVKIGLFENYMSGTLPPSLGSITTLTALALNMNQLYGSVPVSLGRLTALTDLWLSDTMLGGSFPASTAALTALTMLRLQGSGLCGKVPMPHQPNDGPLPPCPE